MKTGRAVPPLFKQKGRVPWPHPNRCCCLTTHPCSPCCIRAVSVYRKEISFEEVKAILEMHGSREVVRCFSNAEIEQLLYKHLDVAIRNFNYAPVENIAVDQDAIAFRLYVTPSETQPSIRTEYGNEATKVQNLYVYCQFLTRFDPDAGPSAQ